MKRRRFSLSTARWTWLPAAAVAAALAGTACAGTQAGTEPEQVHVDAAAPLRDAFIARGPDGSYFLTGTAGTHDKQGRVDFDYNRGVRLWRSTGLKAWTSLGLVWDRVERLATSGRKGGHLWIDWSAPAERIDGLLANATTTPKLYRIKDAWFLLFAQNGQNVFVLKSESGKPDGPYADHGYLATRGGHPSFFVDDDGSVYLVLADGWIARMQPDLREAAEDIRPLLPAAPAPGKGRLTLGDRGVALFKRNGRYQVLAARWHVRGGAPSHDAVLWTAETVYGPYRETRVVLPDTGPVTVFQGPGGGWMAVSSRPVRDTPRIVEVPPVPEGGTP
jgi:hypothetical protein